MIQEDGSGKGFKQKVDSNLQAHTRAITENENKFINLGTEESYLLYMDITPTGVGSEFLYFKNTSDDDVLVNWYRVWSGTNAEAIDIYTGKMGTPGNTTAVTPGNMNITSANSATGEFYESVALSGLSGGTLLDRLRLSGDGNDVVDAYPGDIVIQKGGVMTLQSVTGTYPLEVTLSFYYKAKE